MKSLIFTLLVLPLTIFTSFGAEKEVKADIKQVTLYPDRAQVSSESALSLQTGETVLKFRGLSPYILRETIQVSGEGGYTIMSVSHSNNYLSTLTDSPEVKDIKTKVEALIVKIEDEKTAIAVLAERENFLVANRLVTGNDAALTAEQYKALLELYSSNIDLIRNTILKKSRLIKEYEKQLQDMNNQLEQSMGQRRLPTGEISVTVSSTKPVAGKISLSYIVTNAGWTPSYDIRVADIESPITLVYIANVIQSTGNDWKGVKLSFTNANPSQSGVIPVLYPWHLNFMQPMMDVALRGRAAGIAVSEAKKAEVSEIAMLEDIAYAVAPTVSISTGATTFSFDVTVPSDIPSDGQIKTIEIGRTTTAASFVYESVPKLEPKAFLTGRIEKWEDLNIIGGDANLYFEDTFVGQSYLSPAQFGDTMKISLGSDKGITIKRDRQTELTSKRMIGSNKIETRSFKITVRNGKRDPVTLRINDQIPVSSNSEITVEPTQLSGGRLDPVTGMVIWEFTLDSQQSREFILTYTVKYPKDKVVILE